ncbi:MAG: DUF3808 domain-containing protein [Bacteroidetes bacterium]|nr:DUF3808 domain-containing protein [Bacteroidota bacterium]
MKHPQLYIPLLCILISHNAFAQWPDDPEIDSRVQRGIDYIYNYEFEKAERIFSEVIQLRPEHPVGYFFRAMIQWERIICNFDDESQDEKFYDLLQVVIDMCDKRLKQDSNDVTALFFKGGAIGFRGRLRGNRGQWIAAANDGLVALPLVRRAYELQPTNTDVLLGIGIYNYYAAVVPEKYPYVKPFLLFLPSGNREKGLEQLRTAAEKAKYAHVEAAYFLMQSYVYFEKDFRQALEIARKFHNKYPNNSVFHRYYGRALIGLGNMSEAQKVYREIETRYKIKQLGYDSYDAREAYYYLGKIEFQNGNYQSALNYLYKCDELSRKLDKNGASGYMALANLMIGMIYDDQGKRQYAIAQYKKVLDMKEYENSHDEAKKYLAVPYSRR